jgi:ABC-type Mn2+/Zn2+ transport system ATPase subunit
MNGKVAVNQYNSLNRLVQRLKDDFKDNDFILIFAHNGTGKTRLSMAFKDAHKTTKGKKKADTEANTKNTLYFNAFTEDLFSWDNDLENDSERVLRFNQHSKFFKGLEELEMDSRIREFLERYADFDFKIDYTNWEVVFSRTERNPLYNQKPEASPTIEHSHIKISRGEENLFIWCFFLAVVQLAMDADIEAYNCVQYIYIDDPVSSLDDNNVISVASDLSKLLKSRKEGMKAIISSHHGLFFNVMWNELKKSKTKAYFYHQAKQTGCYTLQPTNETPFFHHVAMISELKQAIESDRIYTYHFNILRTILEKTATFFGYNDFSSCIQGLDDEALYARALNLLSHGKHSIYEPKEMVQDNKQLFKDIFKSFQERYQFELPELQKSKGSKP